MKNDAVLTTSTTGKAEEAFVSRAEYGALKRENAELNQKLDFLNGAAALAKKKDVWRILRAGCGAAPWATQLLLFNEAEAWTPEKRKRPATAVAAHTGKRSSDLDEVLPGGRYR